MKTKVKENQKGITLIALVITISSFFDFIMKFLKINAIMSMY